MNEEEKEAIKVLNNFNPTDCGIEDTQAIETILNLIDKQQEQIEELRETCNKYNDMKYFVMVADRYISKDKIKEKIEEYKKKCNECNFQNSEICKDLKKNYNCSIQSVLELLKELLGETNE